MTRRITPARARKKVRNHLKRCGSHQVHLTEHMVAYWWSVLNQAVFEGELPYPVEIVVKPVVGAYGECLPTNDNNGSIYIHSGPMKRKLFIIVLVHEMVHQHEMVHYGEMTHGKTFYEWKETIEGKIGVPLMRVY